MAIWQYTFYILPRKEVEAKYKGIPSSLEEGFIDNFKGWSGITAHSVEGILTLSFGLQRQLNHGPIQFGEEDLSCVKLSFNGPVLELVTVRLDLRQAVANQISSTIRLCNHLDGIMTTPEGATIQSRREDLIEAIKKSRSLKFVKDPQKFFESIDDD